MVGITRLVNRLIAPLYRRVRLTVGRGIIKLVNDDLKEQGVQISLLAGEVHDDVERYQEYGFTSVPHSGAEAITVFVGGNRDHGVVIATGDRRYRLKGLKAGEVALYSDEGDNIVLKRGRVVEVNTETMLINASTAVEFNTPWFAVNASTAVDLNTPDVNCSGNVRDSIRSIAADRNIYSGHSHQGDSGGTTSTPNQVQ